MRKPGCVTALVIVLLVLLGPVLIAQVTASALLKLRLAPQWIPPIVLGILLGSQLNLPLWSRVLPRNTFCPTGGIFGIVPLFGVTTRQVVAINVGGGLIPAALALYELGVLVDATGWAGLVYFLLTLAAVTVVARGGSQLVPGLGVTMRPLWPALTAAVLALGLDPAWAPACAFSAGVWGVILGADLSRLGAALDSDLGFVSLGGAGTFDGILMTGLLSVFLA